MGFAEASAKAIKSMLEQPAPGHAPAAERMMRLMHETEIAGGTRHRSPATGVKLYDQVGLADERPGHRDEIGVPVFEDSFHRRRSPHPADEDDRHRDSAP